MFVRAWTAVSFPPVYGCSRAFQRARFVHRTREHGPSRANATDAADSDPSSDGTGGRGARQNPWSRPLNRSGASRVGSSPTPGAPTGARHPSRRVQAPPISLGGGIRTGRWPAGRTDERPCRAPNRDRVARPDGQRRPRSRRPGCLGTAPTRDGPAFPRRVRPGRRGRGPMSPVTWAVTSAGGTTSSRCSVKRNEYGSGGRTVHRHRLPATSPSAWKSVSQGHHSRYSWVAARARHIASGGTGNTYRRSESSSTGEVSRSPSHAAPPAAADRHVSAGARVAPRRSRTTRGQAVGSNSPPWWRQDAPIRVGGAAGDVLCVRRISSSVSTLGQDRSAPHRARRRRRGADDRPRSTTGSLSSVGQRTSCGHGRPAARSSRLLERRLGDRRERLAREERLMGRDEDVREHQAVERTRRRR